MKKILNEELSTQLRLISYDRSLTLYEQDEKIGFDSWVKSIQKGQEDNNKRRLQLDPNYNKNDPEGKYRHLYAPIDKNKLTDNRALRGADWREDKYFIPQDYIDGIARNLHWVLPVASIAVVIFAAPLGIGIGAAALIGFGLDAIDALIYRYHDKDPYAEGLSWVFALVGPFDYFLRMIPKKTLISFLDKVGKAIKLTKPEQEIGEYVLKNGPKLSKQTNLVIRYQKILNVTTKSLLKHAADTSMTLRLCLFLIKTFKLSIKFTAYMVLPFYTWDYLASKLGICNSTDSEALMKSNWLIIKLLGHLNKNTQVFSTPCSLIQQQEIMKMINDQLLGNPKKTLILVLKSLIDKNMNISIKQKNTYSEVIKGIQYSLQTLGYDTIPAPIVPKIINKDIKVLPQTGQKFRSVGEYVMDLSQKNKNVFTTTKSYRADINFGYYNKTTEELVKIYQKTNGLTVDGAFGPNTAEQMIDDLKNTTKNIKSWVDLAKTKDSVVLDPVSSYVSDTLTKADNSDELKVDNLKKQVMFEIEQINDIDFTIPDDYEDSLEKVTNPDTTSAELKTLIYQ